MLIVRNVQGDAMAKIIAMRRSGWCCNRARPPHARQGRQHRGHARKLLFWSLKPLEVQLTEVAEITLAWASTAPLASKSANTMLVICAPAPRGRCPAADKKDAEDDAAAMRQFLGLASS